MTASPTPTDAGAGMPGELFAESANNPEKHHADPAYCSGGGHSPDAGNMDGLPSEEAIARALAEALRQKPIPDHIWNGQVESFRYLEGKYPDYATGYSLSTDAFRQARALLSLIRPAFEAKEREIEGLREERDAEHQRARDNSWDYEVQKARALSAEAKLAQAVEALEPFADFAQWTDDEGWACNIHREAISVWFGPSDFRRARSAARGET